jgi:cytochrome c biogenesis protein CcdA/thiol-disulfide isomerase/thioredoxin
VRFEERREVFLVLIGFVAGLIAGISPCVLPVLPVVFFAGATTKSPSSLRRAFSIVLGLIVSFSILILAGTEIVSLFHLPDDFLHYLGIGLLIVVGIGLSVPQLGVLIERPFARMVARQPALSRGGFVIGLALGLVFVPCAGPVLSTIIVLGAKEHVNFQTVLVTVAFSLGAAVPLLFVAFAGGALVERARWLRQKSPQLRLVGGAVLIVMAALIWANVFNSLQTEVPGYTNALQQHVEGTSKVTKELQSLSQNKVTDGSLASCRPGDVNLQTCGMAPNFADVTAWLNTPGNKPLSIKELRGKVVLVDFWTYSCINCERTLPHIEAWYNRYKNDGFVVVGVHTPEFSFEHVVSNVKAMSKSLGVDYPVAVDDNYGTWDAYNNEYWPADYLIDANGVVRHDEFGEGDYSLTESLIRKLLLDAHPGLKLPPRTDVPNLTPNEATNPESYVGYERVQYLENTTSPAQNVPVAYQFPKSLSLGYFAFSGLWTDHEQEATAGKESQLEISYEARDVYLVMGGSGTVTISDGNGMAPQTIDVGGIPRLYTLFHSKSTSVGTLVMKVSPGVQAYDFTFG